MHPTPNPTAKEPLKVGPLHGLDIRILYNPHTLTPTGTSTPLNRHTPKYPQTH